MNRSRSHLGVYASQNLNSHKPGTMPKSSQKISPIISNRHKYELKKEIWPKQTIELWFQNHSPDDRRVVFSFLNTLYTNDNRSRQEAQPFIEQCRASPSPRLPKRINGSATHSSNQSVRRMSNMSGHESRASKRDLGEVLESLQSFRISSSTGEKSPQVPSASVTVPLPDLNTTKNDRKPEQNQRRSVTAMDKYTEVVQPQNSNDKNTNAENDEDNRVGRRYLSQTWRVINPREDMEPYVRPENNRSSFFNYTKKVYPEYFFIHPDWY